MRLALQEEGLFPDEADALLNTWELSYFKSPGLRLFFMVPRAWTDHYLPLEVSVPCEIKRAMIGRLELATPEQRALLKELAQTPVPPKRWAYYEMDGNRAVMRGGAMPPAYRDLGRLRQLLRARLAVGLLAEGVGAFGQVGIGGGSGDLVQHAHQPRRELGGILALQELV